MSKEPKTTILIVDDDVDHNDLQKDALLASCGDYEVIQAHSPEECLDAIAKAPCALVVLDYTLPQMNGLELIDKISELGFDIPILMVTGHGDESVAVEAMKHGAYDYLSKAPDTSFLQALPMVVERVLEQHRTMAEKKRLEDEVRVTKDYLEKIIDNAGDAVIVSAPSGKIISVNKACLEMFQMTGEKLVSSSIYDLVKDEEDRTKLQAALDPPLGQTNRADLRMIESSGRALEVSLCSSSIKVRDQKQIIIISRDMTEMVDMQRQLIESEKMAAIGELVGSVAHELNNKLGPILGYAELMQRSAKDDKTRQRLRVIEDSALKAKSIIESLLGFSRHRKPLRSYFDLNKVLQDALSLMEFQLKKSKVKVELSLAEGLPDVFADSVQVQQIFVNLLKNAYQAVQERANKKIGIKTFKEEKSIVFSVKDNGMGIPELHLNRVFDPFFTTRKSGKGVGLGLSVAYGIVKEHNGDIMLDSKEKSGTEVIVKLPVFEGPVPPVGGERIVK